MPGCKMLTIVITYNCGLTALQSVELMSHTAPMVIHPYVMKEMILLTRHETVLVSAATHDSMFS